MRGPSGQSHAVNLDRFPPLEAAFEALAARVVGPLAVAPGASIAAAARRPDGTWVGGWGVAGRLTHAPGAPLVTAATPFDLTVERTDATKLVFACEVLKPETLLAASED